MDTTFHNLDDFYNAYETDIINWHGPKILMKEVHGRYTICMSFPGIDKYFETSISVGGKILPWSKLSRHDGHKVAIEAFKKSLGIVKIWVDQRDAYRFFNITVDKRIIHVPIENWDGPKMLQYNNVGGYKVTTIFNGSAHGDEFAKDKFPNMFVSEVTRDGDNEKLQWPTVNYRRLSDAMNGHAKIVDQITAVLKKSDTQEYNPDERQLIL